MEKFLGRELELKILQNKFNKDSFGMAIVYGRRRIGKTMLINEFMDRQACKKIYFTAVEQNEKILLSMMKDAVLSSLAPELIDIVDFPDFEKLFEFVGKYAVKERIIFFIDEYPYLAKQCKSIQSVLQKTIDKIWKNTNLFFILCGSLVGFMKDEVLAESAPLYGRSDLELKLRPFNYNETALFLKGYSNEDKAIVYGLTGGVAKYIKQFDCNKTLDQNIIEQFYTLGGYFSEEQIKTVITNERQNPVLYNSIIYAIATGHTKNNEIKVCADTDDITYPLKVLANAEIIERRVSSKPYYVLCDSMLEFWFKYVSRAVSLINAGSGARYYKTSVKKQLHNFMGKVFEKMAKDYLLKRSGTNGIPMVTDITDYQTSIIHKGISTSVEIDLYASTSKKIAILGECKFKSEKFDNKDLENFLKKVKLVKAENAFLCVFSLSGFTDYVKNNNKNILLVSIDNMY